MKSVHNSFLFFCFYTIFVGFSHVVAQEQEDSYSYNRDLILNPKNSTDLTSAYSFFENRIQKNLEAKDTISAIQDLRLVAIGQFDLGLFYDSEISAVKALRLLDNLKVSEVTVEAKMALYNQLGKLYRKLANYDFALEYYNKSLALAERSSDSITIMNNRANIRVDQLQFELAIEDLEIVYQNSLTNKSVKNRNRALSNLGFAQSKVDHPDAFSNLETALNARLANEDTKGTYSSYAHLTEYYLDRNEKDNALTYANKAFEVAKLMNSASYIEDARKHILLLSDNTLVLDHLRINDSITDANSTRENRFAAMKYDFIKERQRAQENELKIEKEKRSKLLYQAIGVFIVLLGVFVYFIIRSRHHKEKLQEVYHTEARISKKIHDEVANDLYHLMIKVQGQPQGNEEVLDDLEGIYTKTRDISKEISAIDVDHDYDILLNDLLDSYRSDDVTIITRHISKIDWDSMSEIKKTGIYRVLQELMTNMKKHSQASLVAVVFTKKNNKLIIEYSDNGVGSDLKLKNGLLNTGNRMESIGGTISFDSQVNKGFKATMSI
jgi:signal transduction histidine kinase